LPPLLSIAALAPLVTDKPVTLTLLVISPERITLTFLANTGTSLFQYQQIDIGNTQVFQIGQANFSASQSQRGFEATFWQTTLQRHLTAFETNAMKTARPGFLTLVAAASCLAQTGTNTTSNSTFCLFCAKSRLQII
jgi:hypothetical protein